LSSEKVKGIVYAISKLHIDSGEKEIRRNKIMPSKIYKVDSEKENGRLVWSVSRIGHMSKGNYLMAKFYDRAFVQIFLQALEDSGYKQQLK
jgi:hypothetical protein